MRVDWYEPPRRNTLPLLRYSVNPGKTMILKVMVISADADGPETISVALFDINGEFMYDTSFRGATKVKKAVTWLRNLFADTRVVEVSEKDGRWVGSRYGRKGAPPLHGFEKFAPAYTRSWLGGHDAP